MFRLRKRRPPFGTTESPILEYAYSEQVKVVNGLCEVHHQATRDYLLKIGYEELELEEATVTPSENGLDEAEESPVSSPQTKPKNKPRHGKR